MQTAIHRISVVSVSVAVVAAMFQVTLVDVAFAFEGPPLDLNANRPVDVYSPTGNRLFSGYASAIRDSRRLLKRRLDNELR